MITLLAPRIIKKIVFFAFSFAITGSAFANSTSVPGIQINWTTDIPAKTQLNQKQTSESADVKNAQTSNVPGLPVLDMGLLPTSRFYFLKNWWREFERLTTLNDQKRIDLELNIADEIANEMKILKNKLAEIQTRLDAGGATDRALHAYNKAHRLMRERTIRVWEKLADSDRDKLLDKITKQILEHSKIFTGTTDSLNPNSENIKRLIDSIKLDLQETIEALMQKIDAQSFTSKLGETGKSILQNKFKISETTHVGFFDYLIEKASDTMRSAFQNAKTEILNAITKKLKLF